MKKNIALTPDIETLFGTRDENLHVLEDGLNINIDQRSDRIELEGAPRDVARAEQLFADYEHLRKSGHQLVNGDHRDLRSAWWLATRTRLCAAWPKPGASVLLAGGQFSRKAPISAATWKPSSSTTWCSESAPPAPVKPIWPWLWRSRPC